jgi:SAM-dependent methyltransferase
MLSSGIPGIDEYQSLDGEPDFRRLYDYSRSFQAATKASDAYSRIYGVKWVDDPFLQWSRRWEYVYVLQRLEDGWKDAPKAPLIADAGSGFTFFPFYLQELRPDARILCIDSDPTAGRAIAETRALIGHGPEFAREDLERLGQASESLDAVFSISVIEHTNRPGQVIEEIHRVLIPGGMFVCTFDVSFETGSPMRVEQVASLVRRLHEMFDAADEEQTKIAESAAQSDRVTTEWISGECRDRLPWRYPRLVWLYDALRGRFRSDLYRPMTFYCGTFYKKLA